MSTQRPGLEAPGGWISAIVGIVTAIAAISVSSLVAAVGRSLRSPIFDVGDRFIDLTPSWLKNVAIDVFGTNDKAALLVGIGLVLLLYSAGVGLVAMRTRISLGIAGIAVFGLVGAGSAIGSGRGLVTAAPSLVGATAGGLLLWWLNRVWSNVDEAAGFGADKVRRQLLQVLGLSTVGAGLVGLSGVQLGRRFDVSYAVGSGTLPQAGGSLPPPNASVSFDHAGLAPFFTPNEDFYRIDTALTIPQVPPDDYRLAIRGLVDREIELSYRDLLARAQVESDITLTCVSNEVGGRLVGTARWQGVRLDDLLEEAGVAPSADQIVGRSYDGYTCGFPVSVGLDGRDALVAVGMNGRPLPLEHGYPARLVVPGLYGYASATKWLREIELTTFDSFDQYWVPRGWAERAPIKTQSRIDTPSAFQRLPPGPGVVAGVAWAQTRGIDRVEIRIDDGPWAEAELAAELNDTTWRQWRHRWMVTPGRHDITVRASDRSGETQSMERSRPMPDGATGWHNVVVMGEE